ncbi:hypothetical protein PDJAM_G00173170, partial [Pangasius djambal]|nr:hypothetical protein [Pangasius djambal]
MRMGYLLSLVPLKVSSSYHLREFFLATVATGLLIRDKFTVINSNIYNTFFVNPFISVKL